MTFLFPLLAFISGALPFSVWIGRYALGKDIRQFGDGNPGATNVLRAGGKGWYAFALCCDMSKGIVPVGVANYVMGISGWELVAIAIMPPLGHAFSPFLGGNGGKALAAAAGVWFGLSIPLFVLAVVGIVVWSLIVKPSGYAVFGTMAVLLAAMFLGSAEFELFAVWTVQTILFLWKQRSDLRQPPRLFFRNRHDTST